MSFIFYYPTTHMHPNWLGYNRSKQPKSNPGYPRMGRNIAWTSQHSLWHVLSIYTTKKSCIWETQNLLACADSSTNAKRLITFVIWLFALLKGDNRLVQKKSCIQETQTLTVCADSSTNTENPAFWHVFFGTFGDYMTFCPSEFCKFCVFCEFCKFC